MGDDRSWTWLRRATPLSLVVLTLLLLLLLSGAMPSGSGPVLAAARPAEPEAAAKSLRVHTPDYTLDESGLRVAGYASSDLPGAPELPMWTALVEMPAHGEIRMEWSTSGAREIASGVRITSVPAPAIAPGQFRLDRFLGQERSAIPVTERPDPAIYGVGALYPASLVALGPEQWARGKRLVPVRVFPFQYEPQRGTLLHHPEIVVTLNVEGEARSASDGRADEVARIRETRNPALGGSGALRIYTGERGLHALSYSALVGAGVPVGTVNPATFAMSYLGEPVAIEVRDGGDGFGPGDRIVFFAQPYLGRFMNENVYWLTWGGAAGARIASRGAVPIGDEVVVDRITQTLRIDPAVIFNGTLERPTEADHWFDDDLYALPGAPAVRLYDNLEFDDLLDSGSIAIRALFYGFGNLSPPLDQSVRMRLNGETVGLFQWDGDHEYYAEANSAASILAPTGNQIELEASLDDLPPHPSLTRIITYPDWVEVDYPARPDAEQDRLLIDHVPAGSYDVQTSGFTTPGISIYDVRQPNQPVRLTTTQIGDGGGGYLVRFWDRTTTPASGRSSYALSSTEALHVPVRMELDTPSTLRDTQERYDYIAVVHDSLSSAIQPLLDHRAAEGLRVWKVDVQDIYDEFSFGRVHQQGIKDFFTFTYDRQVALGDVPPAYALLVGDGHYDFTDELGLQGEMPLLIPPYFANVDPWLVETAADNQYVTVDGPADLIPDISLGRLSARVPADVDAYFAKVLAYEAAPAGDWQERVVYVAGNDADPAGNFHTLSDHARLNFLPPGYQNFPLYYDLDGSGSGTYTDTTALRADLFNHFGQGALMIQWFGHASQLRWSKYSLYKANDVQALPANDRLPLTFSNSCIASWYINLDTRSYAGNIRQALGESTTLTPGRGSIADIGPTGFHIGSALRRLDEGVTEALFQDHIAEVGRAADAGRLYFLQNSNYYLDLIDTTIVLGDPALRLRLPDRPRLKDSTLVPSSSTPLAGTAVSYTVAAVNDGSAPATGVTMVVDYDQSRVTISNTGGAVDNGSTLTWQIGTAPVGSTARSFTAVMNAGLPIGTVVETAVTIAADGLFDVGIINAVTIADPTITPTVTPTASPTATVTPTRTPTATPTATPVPPAPAPVYYMPLFRR